MKKIKKKKEEYKYFEMFALEQITYRKLVRAKDEKEAFKKLELYMKGKPKVYDCDGLDYQINEVTKEEYKELQK